MSGDIEPVVDPEGDELPEHADDELADGEGMDGVALLDLGDEDVDWSGLIDEDDDE